MNADEIMQVLRLTAMGRIGHPSQEEFAQKLAKLWAEPAKDPMAGLIADLAVDGAGSPKRARKQKAD